MSRWERISLELSHTWAAETYLRFQAADGTATMVRVDGDDLASISKLDGAPREPATADQPPSGTAGSELVHMGGIAGLQATLVIACNYQEDTEVAAEGALAYVQTAFLGGNLPARMRLLVRSRDGQFADKWEATRRLKDFRLTAIPPEHIRFTDERVNDATTEKLSYCLRAVEELADVGAQQTTGDNQTPDDGPRCACRTAGALDLIEEPQPWPTKH